MLEDAPQVGISIAEVIGSVSDNSYPTASKSAIDFPRRLSSSLSQQRPHVDHPTRGGDKRLQDADIKRAKEYWRDWKRRNT